MKSRELLPNLTLPEPLKSVEEVVRELLSEMLANGFKGISINITGETHLLAGKELSDNYSADISIPSQKAELIVCSENSSVLISYINRWKAVLRLAVKEQELNSLTVSLIDTTDQLVSLYSLSKGSPSSLTPAELGEYFVEKIYDVIPCQAVLLIDPNGSHKFSGDKHFQREMVDRWNQAENTNKLFRAGETAKNQDVLVANFTETRSGGVVIYAQEHITTQSKELIETVVSYVDGILALSSLHEIELQNAVLNRDIEMAGLLADQVMPKWTPSVQGIEVAARCNYARLASGDFYNYFQTPYGLLAAVGDVSGKGLPAALVMTMVSTTVAIASSQVNTPDPEEVINIVNKEVYEYLSNAGVFVTMAITCWDSQSLMLSIANAGHSPVLAVSSESKVIEAGSPPLGVLPEITTGSTQIQFNENDFLLLGSDGVVEQENSEGTQIGYDDFEKFVCSQHGKSSEKIVDNIFKMVEQYSQGVPQDDDRTVLIVKRTL